MANNYARWEPSYLEDFTQRLRQRLTIIAAVGLAVFTMGIAGFMAIENMSFIDAFYMTVITLSTVGFGEVKPLSPEGKVFTSFLIISGVGTFAYAATSLSHLLVEGEFRKVFDARRRKKLMEKLKDHVIVCGFGRVGEKICEELEKANTPFVVIDDDPKRIEVAEAKGYLFVYQDTTESEALKRANIERAKALIAALGDDADNLFLTITAKELNPKIIVVARVNSPQNQRKLEKAGADKVVAPHVIGALRMAQAAIKPVVADFVELATTGRDLQFLLEEVKIPENSPVCGKSIIELELRKRTGAIIIAMVKKGKLIKSPEPTEKLEAGDLLITLGSREDIEKLEKLIITGNV
ncbi:TrkA domain-containing protein [Thermosulfidibacter takaii ABI70S6]|uniref:TrkA domain-containing protein n=1 Tax=Thermosulfidibacter takaii (strain DSM 17441 / JCM 13301 / NBRC 103674 / ABI70S6) TaxID=1298851 RepID=A0A0S3QVN1_THET7|nr:potassium channel protein [Thermosulfidibacter takaii]BAT72373.1 TrkA domain-containing protein [Thermosulfidibacter takaii ABI70S6]